MTNTTNDLSFNNDPELKKLHVAQAEKHYELDMLMAGTYGGMFKGDFKGCSVGCFSNEIPPHIEGGVHRRVATHRGLPQWLIHLQDALFEGLPNNERNKWHVQLAKAIPVGIDLKPVRHKLAIKRLDRLISLQQTNLGKNTEINLVLHQTIAALNIVRQCHEAELNTASCNWSAAESAAWSAAESAAWSAAESAESARSARSAAESAAWSAAESARSARSAAESARSARSAAESAESAAESAESARSARSAAYRQERDDLLFILRNEC